MYQSRSQTEQFVEHAALTDIGLRRANNQDSMAVALAGSGQRWLERGHLFMVADGMGAHAAGELASKIATDVVPLSYHKLREKPPPDALLAAIRDANAQIYSRAQASIDFKGMGTTICALALTPQGAVLGHVGDSRVYRWRDHRLEQLTFDHSLLWEMRAAGQLPEEDSESFVPRNIITRSLGPHPDVQVDMEGPFPVQVGDIFVLCSDGLSGPVEDTEIGQIIGCMPPEEAVRALVALANLRGGPDNITVIVVRVTEEPHVPDGDPPDSTEQERPTKPFHPVALGTVGVLGLGALILGGLGKWFAAAGSLIGAVIVALVAVAQRTASRTVSFAFDGRTLGRGPYATIECKPDVTFSGTLSQVVQQLRDAAAYGDWMVDWSRFNKHSTEAASAVESGDYCRAVSEYSHAISFMMTELKSQRSRK
jgi:protein phosphatase